MRLLLSAALAAGFLIPAAAEAGGQRYPQQPRGGQYTCQAIGCTSWGQHPGYGQRPPQHRPPGDCNWNCGPRPQHPGGGYGHASASASSSSSASAHVYGSGRAHASSSANSSASASSSVRTSGHRGWRQHRQGRTPGPCYGCR